MCRTNHRDHPRVCGEKQKNATLGGGKRGITPAYAGKSGTRGALARRGRDHPRVCGEKNRCPPVRPAPAGSPPRMRGKARADSAIGNDAGITPAYAGKSIWWHGNLIGGGDHPRVCGEKSFTRVQIMLVVGSPPRMRGKAQKLFGIIARVRITPAYAGKSANVAIENADKWDHPRVCGEKSVFCTATS